MMRLRPILDRYSEAIQWDLRALLGIDLIDYFRGERTWLELGRFLRELSHVENSHFVVAQANDPEVARALYERREAQAKLRGSQGRKYRPSAYEWGVVPQLLKGILDRLGEIEAIEGSRPLPKGTKRLKPPKGFPMPRTAMERIELDARIAYFESLDRDVEEAQERYRREHGGQTDNPGE